MSMMVSFVLSFFPRDVLDEILNLIESVSEDFPSYSLSKLSAWAKRWLIKFNAQKTEIMLISNTYNDHNIELIMDNTVLQIVNSHKHLGVVLSSNNKWTNHIDTIIQSDSKQISFLRKLKYKFSKNSLNKIYCTYIRPLLEYANELWDGCNQTDADRLEKIQQES